MLATLLFSFASAHFAQTGAKENLPSLLFSLRYAHLQKTTGMDTHLKPEISGTT